MALPALSAPAVPFNVDDFIAKLSTAETTIRGQVSGAVPKVRIDLPRISISEQGKITLSSIGGFSVSVNGVSVGSPPLPPAPPTPGSDVEEGRVPLLSVSETGDTIRDAAASKVGGAIEQAEDQFVTQLRPLMITALASLAVVVGAAFAGLGPIVGAMAAAVASSSAFAVTMRTRATSMRSKLLEQIDVVMAKVVGALKQATELILSLTKRVTEAIDDMAEQQKPAFEKVEKLQTMKSMVKGINIPDVPDLDTLKKPIQAVEDKIKQFVQKIEVEVPQKINELLRTSSVGKVAYNDTLFNGVFVILPSLVVLVANVGLAFVQISKLAVVTAGDVAGKAGDVATSNAHIAQGEFSAANSTAHIVASASGQSVDWMTHLQPWVCQMVAMVLQVAIAVVVTRISLLVPVVNGAAETLELDANTKINAKITEVVDQFLGAAFKLVTTLCDGIFPKLNEVLAKLKEAIDMVKKAGMPV